MECGGTYNEFCCASGICYKFYIRSFSQTLHRLPEQHVIQIFIMNLYNLGFCGSSLRGIKVHVGLYPRTLSEFQNSVDFKKLERVLEIKSKVFIMKDVVSFIESNWR